MSTKIEFTSFTPEEASLLGEGKVVTKKTVNGWTAFAEAKGVGRHTCTMFFGKTEEEAKEAASWMTMSLPGIRADGPHFH